MSYEFTDFLRNEKRVTPAIIQKLKEFKQLSTLVTGWYPHDDHPHATVRGPFGRWFTVSVVNQEYRNNVAPPKADAQYAAAAMNSLPMLIDHIEKQEQRLKEVHNIMSKLLSYPDDLSDVAAYVMKYHLPPVQ